MQLFKKWYETPEKWYEVWQASKRIYFSFGFNFKLLCWSYFDSFKLPLLLVIKNFASSSTGSMPSMRSLMVVCIM